MAFLKNTSKGLRGVLLRNGQRLWIEAGATASVASAAVLAKPGDVVETDGSDAQAPEDDVQPGPLDGSVDDLAEHLATLNDVDEVQKLIDAESAGKARKGAISALEARRDELLAA